LNAGIFTVNFALGINPDWELKFSNWLMVNTKMITGQAYLYSGKIIDLFTAFMPGRNILEGVIVLHEKKLDGIILKLDFEKAYDKMIRWCSWIIASIRPGIELFCYGGVTSQMADYFCQFGHKEHLWYDDVIIELYDRLRLHMILEHLTCLHGDMAWLQCLSTVFIGFFLISATTCFMLHCQVILNKYIASELGRLFIGIPSEMMIFLLIWAVGSTLELRRFSRLLEDNGSSKQKFGMLKADKQNLLEKFVLLVKMKGVFYNSHGT
ncbi:hypothetical protein ACJX0J_041731, partial [Zea mays]